MSERFGGGSVRLWNWFSFCRLTGGGARNRLRGFVVERTTRKLKFRNISPTLITYAFIIDCRCVGIFRFDVDCRTVVCNKKL